MNLSRSVHTPNRMASPTKQANATSSSSSVHVEELNRRIKTLESTIKSLQGALDASSETLDLEKQRGKETMSQMQVRWREERQDWQDGCDVMQGYYNIEQLRTLAELERVKGILLDEKETNRKLRVSMLQRDYRIVLFQAKEDELEDRIWVLETELENARNGIESDMAELSMRCEAAMKEATQKGTDLKALEILRGKEEKQHAALQREHSSIVATHTACAAKMDRLTLQLSDYEELVRANENLRSQVEKWKQFESAGGVEVEVLRANSVKLENRASQLEEELSTAHNQIEESERTVQKERRRIEKYKEALEAQQKELNEANEYAEQYDAEAKASKEQLGQAHRQIESLQAKIVKLQTEIKRTKMQEAAADTSGSVNTADEAGHEPLIKEAFQPHIAITKRVPSQGKKRATDEGSTESPKNAAGNDQAALPRNNKSKRWSSPDPEEAVAKTSKKTGKATKDESDKSKPSTKKKNTASTSKKKKPTPEVVDEDAEVISQDQPKKKKRKIGRHQNSQMGTFDFGGSEVGGIVIPSVLSPVGKANDNASTVRGMLGSLKKK